MKIALSVVVVASLFLAGCGKKETSSLSKSNGGKNSTRVASNTDIPQYDYTNEIFGDNVGSMAFVDNSAEREFIDANGVRRTVQTNVGEDYENEAPVTWANGQGSETFKTVLYDFNKDEIRASEIEKVQEDIEAARAVVSSGKKIVVQGHCDQFGTASYNMALSERRASNLKEEMVKSGLPAESIQVVGFGQELPVVWSDATNREQKIAELQPNRRSEIELL